MNACALLVLPALFAAPLLCPNGMGIPGADAPQPTAPAPAPLTCLDVVAAPGGAGALAITGARDGQLKVWTVSPDGALSVEDVGALPGAVVAVRWSQAARASTWSGRPAFFALDDGGHVARVTDGVTLIGRDSSGAQDLALVPGGPGGLGGVEADELLATAGTDGAIRFWAVVSSAGVASEPVGVLEGHTGPVAALAFTPPDRKSQLWSGGWDKTLRGWRLKLSGKPGARRVSGRDDDTAGGERELTALAASPGGAALLSASFDGALRLWSLGRKGATPTVLPQRPYQEWVRQLTFSSDGRRAVAVAPAEALLLVVDLAEPTRAQALPQGTLIPAAAAFLPWGDLLVARFDGQLGQVELAPAASEKGDAK